MNQTPHSYAESFIAEDAVKIAARARGNELGAIDATQGTGAYLRHLAHQLNAQSVVEIGTGSGVGSLWLLEGMLSSGTLTSIDANLPKILNCREKYLAESAGGEIEGFICLKRRSTASFRSV